MSRDRRHATALVERIARVREARAKQQLSHALAHEREQRLVVEASTDRLRSTERGLVALLANERLDLLRAGLYQDLASAQQIALENDKKVLKERAEARVDRADELARKTHYRDKASHRARDAAVAYRLMEEGKEAGELIESWVLRQFRRVSLG